MTLGEKMVIHRLSALAVGKRIIINNYVLQDMGQSIDDTLQKVIGGAYIRYWSTEDCAGTVFERIEE